MQGVGYFTQHPDLKSGEWTTKPKPRETEAGRKIYQYGTERPDESRAQDVDDVSPRGKLLDNRARSRTVKGNFFEMVRNQSSRESAGVPTRIEAMKTSSHVNEDVVLLE